MECVPWGYKTDMRRASMLWFLNKYEESFESSQSSHVKIKKRRKSKWV